MTMALDFRADVRHGVSLLQKLDTPIPNPVGLPAAGFARLLAGRAGMNLHAAL
jgi:hypothetical protein